MEIKQQCIAVTNNALWGEKKRHCFTFRLHIYTSVRLSSKKKEQTNNIVCINAIIFVIKQQSVNEVIQIWTQSRRSSAPDTEKNVKHTIHQMRFQAHERRYCLALAARLTSLSTWSTNAQRLEINKKQLALLALSSIWWLEVRHSTYMVLTLKSNNW